MWSHILNHLIMSLSDQHFFEWFSFSDVFLRTSFSELKPFWDLLNSLNRCWFPLPLYTLFSWGQWPCHLCMWLCPLLPQEIICGFDPWVKKIPWSRKWQLTPVFLLGNPMDRGAWWATQSMGSHRVGQDCAVWQQQRGKETFQCEYSNRIFFF